MKVYIKVKASDELPEEGKYVFCECSAVHEDEFMEVCYCEEEWWYAQESDLETQVIYWLKEIDIPDEVVF